jgi:acyl-CoA thioester hydrolase
VLSSRATMASELDDLPDPARITLRRRVEWRDTDAAGIYHWTTVFRLAEVAEASLHTALGIADFTFGATPRVAVRATFRRPLRFNDRVDVELAVEALGRTSIEYRLRLSSDGSDVAEGSVTGVLVDRGNGHAIPWPDDVRARLAGGGLQVERD